MLFGRIRNDLTIYENHAEEWWDPSSYYFRSLQRITPFRLGLLDRWFGNVANKDILDIGCGGGLIAVPLIQQGARLIGMDLSPKSVLTARERNGAKGAFLCADIRALPIRNASADFVVLADVIDHIPDYPAILEGVAQALRPGGKLFVSTINRTAWSWFMAICLGEGLGFIPRGTHDHKLFVRPEELCISAQRCGLHCCEIVGDSVNFMDTLRDWTISMRESKDLSVSYSVLFERLIS